MNKIRSQSHSRTFYVPTVNFFPRGFIVSTKTESNKAEFEEHKSDIILKLIVLRKYRLVPPPSLPTLFDEIQLLGFRCHLPCSIR